MLCLKKKAWNNFGTDYRRHFIYMILWSYLIIFVELERQTFTLGTAAKNRLFNFTFFFPPQSVTHSKYTTYTRRQTLKKTLTRNFWYPVTETCVTLALSFLQPFVFYSVCFCSCKALSMHHAWVGSGGKARSSVQTCILVRNVKNPNKGTRTRGQQKEKK